MKTLICGLLCSDPCLISHKTKFQPWNLSPKSVLKLCTQSSRCHIFLVVNQLKIYFPLTFFRCVICIFLVLSKECKYLTYLLSDGHILSSDVSGTFRQDIIKSCYMGGILISKVALQIFILIHYVLIS